MNKTDSRFNAPKQKKVLKFVTEGDSKVIINLADITAVQKAVEPIDGSKVKCTIYCQNHKFTVTDHTYIKIAKILKGFLEWT